MTDERLALGAYPPQMAPPEPPYRGSRTPPSPRKPLPNPTSPLPRPPSQAQGGGGGAFGQRLWGGGGWCPQPRSRTPRDIHVSFMELASDSESHAGRPLPLTPQSRFSGSEMPLQEKGHVLQLAVTLLGKAVGRETILPAAITAQCRWLVLLEAGTVVGVKGRLLFTRPVAVWHHLLRLRQYSSVRCARQ